MKNPAWRGSCEGHEFVETARRCRDESAALRFWNKPHTQNPHAPNFAELRPATAIKFISGRAARRDASDYEAHFELGHSAHCVDQELCASL
jgi:hypothetical protein